MVGRSLWDHHVYRARKGPREVWPESLQLVASEIQPDGDSAIADSKHLYQLRRRRSMHAVRELSYMCIIGGRGGIRAVPSCRGALLGLFSLRRSCL